MLVAICLTAVLVTAVPALQELGRAARSAEKLFDTLYRELPPTLEAIRLTGIEISDLTDDLSEGVESAGSVVKQVDQGLRNAQRQVQEAGLTTRSLVAGVQAAWKSLTKPAPKRRRRPARSRNPEEPRPSTEHRATVPYEPSWRPQPTESTPVVPHPEPYAQTTPETPEPLPDDSLPAAE
jgi:hypothetical protein